MYKTVLAYHKCPGKGGATYVFERSDLLQSERRIVRVISEPIKVNARGTYKVPEMNQFC